MAAALKTHRDERHGNQATMIQCLLCFVGDRQSLWEQGQEGPNPEETSNLRLKDGVGISRCRGEDGRPRQRALPEYRQEKPYISW